MSPYERLLVEELRAAPSTWLITGVAGFIGSHLLEALLRLGQRVVGVDNFTTGSPRNLEYVKEAVPADAWERFDCREGSITDIGLCREATRDVDFVLHQAAFVSVPLSLEDPVACHDINVTGTLNMLIASRDHRVRRFVYGSSSKVYGDDPRLPKVEAHTGRPLSPYAASKVMNEIYAGQFSDHYGLECIGLRAFNAFGSRQNPFGGYAAVIPKWIQTILRGKSCELFGDGTASRDFVPVENVVQATLLAAMARDPLLSGQVFNVGLGRQTSLNELHAKLTAIVKEAVPGLEVRPPVLAPSRPGAVEHSWADLSLIEEKLGYQPLVGLEDGLQEAVRWYAKEYPPA
jgi:UDP-N-acetylglucosamine/UDP-N-acetylgalactosamine 4-epimerase